MMAYMGEMQNGVTKKSKNGRRRKRRRNGKLTTAKRRNGTTKAGALSFAKKNGLKLVSRSAVKNPRRKHKRGRKRNGIVTASRRNGIFGNTKQDAKQVGSLLGGMALTKIGGRILANFASPFLAQVNLGNYAGLIADGAVALVVAPFIGSKIMGGEGAKLARLGGLVIVGLDLVDQFAPSALSSLNPFNNSPVVLNGNQPLLTPNAVKQIVASTSASPEDKAKVAGAMNALDRGVPIDGGSSGRRMSQLPLYE